MFEDNLFAQLNAMIATYEKTQKTTTIAISGAGGAGKTTLSEKLTLYFENNAACIHLDDYLISRDERKEKNITGYLPEANNIALAKQHIKDLKEGKEIIKPVYSHELGIVTYLEVIKPKKIIIAEGITSLYDELVDEMDIRIFIEADDEVQLASRIKRDVGTRGYSLEEVMESFKQMKSDYKKYIEPTRKNSNLSLKVKLCYNLSVNCM